MTKRYKIAVTEMGQEVRTVGGTWERGAGATPDDPQAYGYTPEIEAARNYERKIFRQIVDDLDLQALVSVVNKIA